jgi:hypothetical protein
VLRRIEQIARLTTRTRESLFFWRVMFGG